MTTRKGPAPPRSKGGATKGIKGTPSKGKGSARKTKSKGKIGSHDVPPGAPKNYKATKATRKRKPGPLEKYLSRWWVICLTRGSPTIEITCQMKKFHTLGSRGYLQSSNNIVTYDHKDHLAVSQRMLNPFRLSTPSNNGPGHRMHKYIDFVTEDAHLRRMTGVRHWRFCGAKIDYIFHMQQKKKKLARVETSSALSKCGL